MVSPSDFNLFDAEDKVLAEAEGLTGLLGTVPDAVRVGVENLVNAYRSGIREQRRLVKLSDRQQSQVTKLNKELARRTLQAEEALQKLKSAQDQLVQAEKLASLGALVGGIAHEINTPVGVALSCATHLIATTERLRELYQADDIGIEDFEAFLEKTLQGASLVANNCHRAAELIGSFKQVAVDRISAERQTFDLGQKIRETLTSLGPQIKTPDYDVVLDCPPGLMVQGHPGMISQIISNLVINAVIHGFCDVPHGRIAIAVRRQGDGLVCLTLADNGVGILPEHLDHVFDPFFTTKMGQGGSGLGLNIVYNLVTGPLGGTIAVTSTVGQGTEFVIVLPLLAP